MSSVRLGVSGVAVTLAMLVAACDGSNMAEARDERSGRAGDEPATPGGPARAEEPVPAPPQGGSAARLGSKSAARLGSKSAVRPSSGSAAHRARDSATAAGLDPRGAFLGTRDLETRISLATEPVRDIELGSGGRSVGFKITLADGTVGYYKPEQTFSAAHWYAEVASYYLDRALGIGRVPPTVGRRMEWAPLLEVAKSHPRLDEVVVQSDGTVRGAFIGWVEGGLEPIRPGRGWEKWIRQNGAIGLSPYQAPYRWRRDLRRYRCAKGIAEACEKVESREPDDRPLAGSPPREELAAELSDMILFDYLTNNIDRWGSHFTNVRTRGDHGPLVFLDNGAGFFHRHINGLMEARLEMLERFRRSTVEAIRDIDLGDFEKRMATDPLAPVLDQHRLEGLRIRRERLLDHVDGVVERYGDDAFSW